MTQSTFVGKLWWGDNLTQTKKNSFNKKFQKLKSTKKIFILKIFIFFKKY